MQKEFEMSMMGELTFFLRLQINQKKKEAYINQIKYVRKLGIIWFKSLQFCILVVPESTRAGSRVDSRSS